MTSKSKLKEELKRPHPRPSFKPPSLATFSVLVSEHMKLRRVEFHKWNRLRYEIGLHHLGR